MRRYGGFVAVLVGAAVCAASTAAVTTPGGLPRYASRLVETGVVWCARACLWMQGERWEIPTEEPRPSAPRMVAADDAGRALPPQAGPTEGPAPAKPIEHAAPTESPPAPSTDLIT